MRDLQTRDDITLVVETFYQKVRKDEILAPIFLQIMETDWEYHIPRMVDFWMGILLDQPSYDGNPMAIHIKVTMQKRLTEQDFARWLQLFCRTIDELFRGAIAEEAKNRAFSIAGVMQYKLDNIYTR